MPTSVHLPTPLLRALDRRAKQLKVSRNRLIVQSLEAAMAAEWSPGFFDKLADVSPDDADAVVEMLANVRARRTRKRAPRL